MAFYPAQFPIYAYHPMAAAPPPHHPYSNQEFYAMYPAEMGGPVYFEGSAGSPPSVYHHPYHQPHFKPGYNNRKISVDSGISNLSEQSGSTGRKTSNTSTISNSSIILEETGNEKEESVDAEKKEKEEDSEPMVEPDDEMCEKIVAQVEFYFSDANITKDKFLLKHVKRNKEGFVSLKLISSFKRVKHLTKDWRQVAFAVEKASKKLAVNDLKTKVRRLEALPEYDETTPSRTVVALNLGLERPTIEGVAEIFSVCGDIVLVRILRPGNPVPADIKPFANKHPEMTDKVCALIEFEKTEFAHKAVNTLNDEQDEDKMKVMELTAAPAKTGKKEEKKRQEKKAANAPQRRFSHAGLNPPSAEVLQTGPRRRISLFHNMKFAAIPEKKDDHAYALNPNAPSFHMQSMRPLMPDFGAFPGFSQPWMMRVGPPMQHPSTLIRAPRVPNNNSEARQASRGGFQKWCKTRMTDNAPVRKPGSRAVPIVAPPKEEEKQEKQEEKPEKPVVSDDKVTVEVSEEETEKSR